MIDRYLVRYFLGIVDHGSFSAAALHCRVTQPTLSAGIAKLEGLVAQRLFDRGARRVRLTEAGVRFAQHARRIEAEFAAAERAVQDTVPRRLVRIGVTPTIATEALGRALAAARAAAPEERIEVVEGRSNELQAKLDRGRIDALLGVIADEDESGETLLTEGYGVAMARSHVLADRAELDADEIAGETMIVRRHCEALAQVSRFFTARGVRPFMAARTVSEDRAAAYVAAGLGITVMPASLVREDVALVALAGFALRRRVGLLIPAAARARLTASRGFEAFRETMAASSGEGAALQSASRA